MQEGPPWKIRLRRAHRERDKRLRRLHGRRDWSTSSLPWTLPRLYTFVGFWPSHWRAGETSRGVFPNLCFVGNVAENAVKHIPGGGNEMGRVP